MDKKEIKEAILLLIIMVLVISIFSSSCSEPKQLQCGSYYSQGNYIIESKNVDGWRSGHYLLEIDSLNTFVLKEISYDVGINRRLCSGYLLTISRQSYALNSVKGAYQYGVLGKPCYNDNNYRIIIKDDTTIVLRKGRWKTVLHQIDQDSIPPEYLLFD